MAAARVFSQFERLQWQRSPHPPPPVPQNPFGSDPHDLPLSRIAHGCESPAAHATWPAATPGASDVAASGTSTGTCALSVPGGLVSAVTSCRRQDYVQALLAQLSDERMAWKQGMYHPGTLHASHAHAPCAPPLPRAASRRRRYAPPPPCRTAPPLVLRVSGRVCGCACRFDCVHACLRAACVPVRAACVQTARRTLLSASPSSKWCPRCGIAESPHTRSL